MDWGPGVCSNCGQSLKGKEVKKSTKEMLIELLIMFLIGASCWALGGWFKERNLPVKVVEKVITKDCPKEKPGAPLTLREKLRKAKKYFKEEKK